MLRPHERSGDPFAFSMFSTFKHELVRRVQPTHQVSLIPAKGTVNLTAAGQCLAGTSAGAYLYT
jgi:hypothetical protein